jgi:hypothetical protein
MSAEWTCTWLPRLHEDERSGTGGESDRFDSRDGASNVWSRPPATVH